MSGASRTARMVAFFRGRAAEVWPGVCEDRFALALGGADGEADARAYERAHPHMVVYMATRTAFFDDAVRAGIADGIDQIVILGAGLDTRAARLASPGVRFFEVDRAESQADKRARIAELAGYPRDAATMVACDFEREHFLDRLDACGFDRARPAVITWEGVTYYLREETVRATLADVAARCHPRTRVFFDTVGKKFARGEVKDEREILARERVAEMGEPIAFGIDDVVPLAHATGHRYVRSTTVDAACLALTGTYERDRRMRFQSLHELRVEPPARPR